LTCNNSTFLVQGVKAVFIYQSNLFILGRENTALDDSTPKNLSFIETIMGQVQRTLADKTQQFAHAAQKLKAERADVTTQRPYFISFYHKCKELQTIMHYSATAHSSNTIQSLTIFI